MVYDNYAPKIRRCNQQFFAALTACLRLDKQSTFIAYDLSSATAAHLSSLAEREEMDSFVDKFGDVTAFVPTQRLMTLLQWAIPSPDAVPRSSTDREVMLAPTQRSNLALLSCMRDLAILDVAMACFLFDTDKTLLEALVACDHEAMLGLALQAGSMSLFAPREPIAVLRRVPAAMLPMFTGSKRLPALRSLRASRA